MIVRPQLHYLGSTFRYEDRPQDNIRIPQIYYLGSIIIKPPAEALSVQEVRRSPRFII